MNGIRKQEDEEMDVGVGWYCIIKQMVFEGFLFFYFCVCFFIPKIIGLDVLRLFLIYCIDSYQNTKPTRYQILQTLPDSSAWQQPISAAAAILQVKELRPCHTLRALHVRWVRRLGQAWATKERNFLRVECFFRRGIRGDYLQSSKDHQLQLFRLIRLTA